MRVGLRSVGREWESKDLCDTSEDGETTENLRHKSKGTGDSRGPRDGWKVGRNGESKTRRGYVI